MKKYIHRSYYFPSTDLPDDLSLMLGFDKLEAEGYETVSVILHKGGVKFILKKIILDNDEITEVNQIY